MFACRNKCAKNPSTMLEERKKIIKKYYYFFCSKHCIEKKPALALLTMRL
jgi:hypothetical protein